MARLYYVVLGVFFVIQILVGLTSILFFIGEEMSQVQETDLRDHLLDFKHDIEADIDERLALLREYSRLSPIQLAVGDNPEARKDIPDFLSSLSMLKQAAFFGLQDSKGKVVYAAPGFNMLLPEGKELDHLLDGAESDSVQAIKTSDSHDCCFWRLSVPVIQDGRSRGVFSAFIPLSPRSVVPAEDINHVRLSIFYKGGFVVAGGGDFSDGISIKGKTRFPKISLMVELSAEEFDQRISYISTVLILILVGGTLIILGVAHYVGRRMFIIPNAKLKALSESLEEEVQKRTATLERQAAQLSLEIRERREAEKEAREAEKLVSTLMEGVNAAFIVIDPKTQEIVRANDVVQSMFGLAPWQILNRPCNGVFEGSPDIIPELLCDNEQQAMYSEGVAHDADGSPFPIARYQVRVDIKGKEYIGVIIVDITERKVLERQLNTAQKLESVGELASGIAHEINTPIQYVGDSVRFVADAFSDLAEIMTTYKELQDKCREAGFQPELLERVNELAEEADLEFIMVEVPKACDRALDGTNRVGIIVRAMKNFAHPGDGHRKDVDINKALSNTIIVAKNEWKYVAGVVEDFGDIPNVNCLPGDINQVFLNIIVNGAHAIGEAVGNSGDKGTITISTRQDGDSVVIEIIDTGVGIPPENRDKIFDPFFTTKEVGRGTGQGLAIVHDIIVERHGGSIDFESEVGKGTKFVITLPLGSE